MAHSWEPTESVAEPTSPSGLPWLRSLLGPVSASFGISLRLLSVVVVCLVIGGSLVANSAPDKAPPARIIAEPAPVDPAPALPAAAPESLPTGLTLNSLTSPLSTSGLVADNMPRLAPPDLCNLIGIGAKGGDWTKSLVFKGEWECVSTQASRRSGAKAKRRDGADGASAGVEDASLFAMARGVREGNVSYLRLKISGKDAAGAEAGAQILAERVTTLFTAMNWPLPERVPLNIRLLHPFKLEEGGTKIAFVKELMEDWRYNLIITVPNPERAVLSGDYRDLVVLSRR